MITDKDIVKMKQVFATSEDHIKLEEKVDTVVSSINELSGNVNNLSRTVTGLSGTVGGLSGTVTGLSKTVDQMKDRLDKVPTKDELMNMIERTYNLATIKVEHERIKHILRERLSVEV